MIPMLASLIGLLILAILLVDILTTVLGANGRSTLSSAVYSVFWRVLRAVGYFLPAEIRQSLLAFGAPLMITVVIALWMLAVLGGFAFLYVGGIMGDIDMMGAGTQTDLPGALRLSLVALSTIGFVEIGPSDRGYSALVAVQAIAGGFVLTLAASYFVGLQQAVIKRRAFAERLRSWTEAGVRPDPDVMEAEMASLLEGARSYPVIYYIRPEGYDRSLPWTLHAIGRASAEGIESDIVDDMVTVRMMLGRTLDVLAAMADGPCDPAAPILAADELEALGRGRHPEGEPLAEEFLALDKGSPRGRYDRYVRWITHMGPVEAMARRIAADLGYEDRWTRPTSLHLLPISDPPRLGPEPLIVWSTGK